MRSLLVTFKFKYIFRIKFKFIIILDVLITFLDLNNL